MKPGRCRCGKLGAWRRLGKSLCFDCTDPLDDETPDAVIEAMLRAQGVDPEESWAKAESKIMAALAERETEAARQRS